MITLKEQKKPSKPLWHIAKSALTKKPAYCTYSTDSIALLAACLTQPRSRIEWNQAYKKKTHQAGEPRGDLFSTGPQAADRSIAPRKRPRN